MMKQILTLLTLLTSLFTCAALAQTPISVPTTAGVRVLPGDATNTAIRVVCINPSTQATESCAGSGAGSSVTITQGGNDAIVDATGALKVLASIDTTGLATSALQTTGNTSLSSIDSKLPTLVTGRVPVDGSGVTQPISGNVGVTGSVAVTGTFWQATQPVSGPLTDIELRATPVPISGTVTANAGTGNFTVTQTTGTNLHMVCDSGCTPGGSTADNSAFTFGTTAISPNGYVFDDVAPNAVTENNVATPRMSANRVPYGIIRDAAGNERGANVNANGELLVNPGTVAVTGTFWQATQPISAASLPLPTDAATETTLSTLNGKVTAVDTGAVVVASSALPTGASTIAEQQTQTTSLQLLDDAVATTAAAIPTKGFAASGTDGTNARVLKVDTGGELQVDVLTLPTIALGASTNNIGDVDILSIAAGDNNIGNVDIVTMPTVTANATLSAETTKVIGTVRTLGNVGAVLDGVNTAATAPANGLMQLGIYNSTEPSPTTGQSVGIQLDSKGRQRQVLMDAAGNTRGANVDANNNLQVVNAAETTKVLGTIRVQGNVGGVMDTTTGSAVPANALYVGTNGSGNLKGIIGCDNTAVLEMTTATTTQIVAASGSTAVYICSLSVQTGGAATVTLKHGTGSNCGTGTTTLGPAWEFVANSGIVEGGGLGMIYKTTASQALCFTSSAAVNVHLHVSYTQF